MTDVQIDAGTLTANREDRIVTGLLLPYGEECRSNLGRFTVDPGVVEIPTDVAGTMSFNVEHAREHPIGRAVSAHETSAGVVASFKIADGPEGDAALEDIATGKRKHLSAEVAGVLVKAGRATAGKLFAAALVAEPAFPSATLLAALEEISQDEVTPPAATEPVTTTEKFSDEFVDENGVAHKRTTTRTTTVDGDTTTIKETTVIEEPEAPAPNQEEETLVAAARVPNTLTASRPAVPAPMTATEVFRALAAIATGQADATLLARLEQNSGPAASNLFAALSDIKYDGAGGVATAMIQPQWIGELWDGLTYEQKYLNLFGHADLTGLKIDGFRWKTKPTGGTWAGNKSAVPSGSVETEAYTTAAKRFAGGHDHAREHLDFGTPGYFESYWKAMTESYAKWADETVVFADVLTAAGVGTAADNPAGLTIGAGLSAVIDGAAAVITANATPSFALVAPALYKSILKTPDNATLGYLNAALGLKEGSLESFTIRPAVGLAAGSVLVGAREAATVYELPGTPVRVEAPDMVKGGLDTGIFGYAGTVIHKADALQLITPYVAG